MKYILSIYVWYCVFNTTKYLIKKLHKLYFLRSMTKGLKKNEIK